MRPELAGERTRVRRRGPIAEPGRAARADTPREVRAAVGIPTPRQTRALGVRRARRAAILAPRRRRAVQRHAVLVRRARLRRAALLGAAGGPACGEPLRRERTAAFLTGGRL